MPSTSDAPIAVPRAATERAFDDLPTVPRLRGVLHEIAAFVWLAAGLVLFLVASGTQARVAAVVYALGLCSMFGVSAIYHRGRWSPEAKAWWRRADHSAIYLAIAGTYTPIVLLTLSPGWAAFVLTIVWGGAVTGVTLNLSWRILPGWMQYTLYIGLGWTAVIVMPQLVTTLGFAWMLLVMLGGVLYTVGAVLLALGRPNPSPRWFGHHEVWHALTIAAATSQLVVVAVLLT